MKYRDFQRLMLLSESFETPKYAHSLSDKLDNSERYERVEQSNTCLCSNITPYVSCLVHGMQMSPRAYPLQGLLEQKGYPEVAY